MGEVCTFPDLGQKCAHTGLIFPPIYRIYSHPLASNSQLRHGTLPLGYTLSSYDNFFETELDCEKIACLDPEIDFGCLVVQHHLTIESAWGYRQAVLDNISMITTSWLPEVLFQDNRGECFTIQQRPLSLGSKGHVIIYFHCAMFLSNPKKAAMPATIVFPDGTVSNNIKDIA